MAAISKILLLLATLVCILGIEGANNVKPVHPMQNTAQKSESLKASSVSGKKLSVFNGLPATPGLFPYIVSLSIPKTDGLTYRCGGILYAQNLIVTAAHCLVNALIATVTIGEIDLNAYYQRAGMPSRVVIRAKQWKIHERYNATSKVNDIALIHLPLNIIPSVNVSIGYLYFYDPSNPTTFSAFYANKIATVVGWGLLGGSSSAVLPSMLQYTSNQRIITTAECQRNFTTLPISTNQICVVPANTSRVQSACQGDSGGPLIIAGYLAGVVSYGYNCSLGYPSVYTNIFPYHLWIDDNWKWANDGKWW